MKKGLFFAAFPKGNVMVNGGMVYLVIVLQATLAEVLKHVYSYLSDPLVSRLWVGWFG